MCPSAFTYLKDIYEALSLYAGRVGGLNSPNSLYAGKEGCLRLAREVGYGLKDYSPAERLDALRSSYNVLCVRLYNPRPPVSAREWAQEIMKMWGC